MKRLAALFLVAVHAASAFFELEQSALTHSSNLFSITPPVINTEMAATNMDEQSFISALAARKGVVAELYSNQARLLNNLFYAAVNRQHAASIASACMQADFQLSNDLQCAEENIERAIEAYVASEATAYKTIVDKKVTDLLSVNQPGDVGKFVTDLWDYEVCRYALSAIESYVYYSEYTKYNAHYTHTRNSAFFEAEHGGAPREPRYLQRLVTPTFNAMKLSEKLYDHMQCANRLLSASIERMSVLRTLSAGLVSSGALRADVTFDLDCINQDALSTAMPNAAKLILLDHFARAIDDIDAHYIKNAKNKDDNIKSAAKIQAVENSANAVLLELTSINKLLDASNMTMPNNDALLENLKAVQSKVKALNHVSALAVKIVETTGEYYLVEDQKNLMLRSCLVDIHASIKAATLVSELMGVMYEVHSKFLQRTAEITKKNITATTTNLTKKVKHLHTTLKDCYSSFETSIKALFLQPAQAADQGAETLKANLLKVSIDKATASIKNLLGAVRLFNEAVISLARHQASQPAAIAQIKAFKQLELPHALLIALQEHDYW